MDNGLGWTVVNASPTGLATARSLGTGSWRGCLVVTTVSWQLLIRILKRVRTSGTESGEDEWFGQGLVHMRLWSSGRDPGLDWAWWLVTVVGKELMRGVQC